ncbi:hypothetical protein, partial [Salmonella enterica]|uniref:hypothetical protein n=1 Tax=Salmonella enterica TaxID=28901 RepID=UPI002FCD7484
MANQNGRGARKKAQAFRRWTDIPRQLTDNSEEVLSSLGMANQNGRGARKKAQAFRRWTDIPRQLT